MWFRRQVHPLSNEEQTNPTNYKSAARKFLSNTKIKVLLIVGGSLVLLTSIVVPVVIVTRSKNNRLSSSTTTDYPSTTEIIATMTTTQTNPTSTSTTVSTKTTSLMSSTTFTQSVSSSTTFKTSSVSSTTNSSTISTTSLPVILTTTLPVISNRTTTHLLMTNMSTITTTKPIMTTTMPMITSTTPLTETDVDLSSMNTFITSEIFPTIVETMTITSSDFNTTAITMIDVNEQFSTDENENIVSIMESTTTTNTTLSNINTDISTTTTTAGRTTTTTMVPPNLLINPGAELGSIVGWDQTGSSPAIVDSDGQFNSNYYPHTGTFCFAGGEGPDSPSRLVQNIKLLNGVQGFTESQLDAGSLRVELSFYYQTWNRIFVAHDLVQISLTFRSSASILNTIDSGEIACTTSHPGWCHYINTFPLPINVRSIDYTMTFIRKGLGGSDIDCYVDDNSLRII